MSEWKISTPIDTFAHPETGSQIDLVSVVHVGQPSYYRNLGSYIMARQDEGFTVHYEEIATSDEPPRQITLLDRMKWFVHDARTDASAAAMVLVETSSRYTTQDYEERELFYKLGAENYDITNADLVSQTSIITSLRGLWGAIRLRRKLEKAASKGSGTVDEAIFGVLKEDIDTVKSGKTGNKRQDQVTIHVRNKVALEGIDSALAENPTARLVLIWGIGHLAGLQSGLLDRGYEHTGNQEIDVAVNRAQLERNIKKHEASLRRQ